MVRREVGAQQVAPLAPTHLAQFVAIQAELQSGRCHRLFRCADPHQVGRTAGIMLGRAEFHQQLITREQLALQGLETIDVATQPFAPHCTLLVDPRIAFGHTYTSSSVARRLPCTPSRTLAQGSLKNACSSFVSRPLGVHQSP
jgi:hypothetical protein